MRIVRGEIASLTERNAERRKVIAVDGIGIMTVLRLTWRRHIALRCDRSLTVVAAQRNVGNRAGGGDSGLLPDRFQQAIDDADAVWNRFPRDGALAGEGMLGVKAGRHGDHC